MSCKFSVPFSGSPEHILNKARNAVVKQGGTFTGDENSGNFKVSVMGSSIKGAYIVTGNDLEIEIESKSFLLPCGAIESYLRNQLS